MTAYRTMSAPCGQSTEMPTHLRKIPLVTDAQDKTACEDLGATYDNDAHAECVRGMEAMSKRKPERRTAGR